MTFYALSTPPGISGIAIIRVSGEKALEIGNQIIGGKISEPRMANLKKFYDQNNEIIDEGIVIWYPKGQSYTDDDLVEFHIHGSKAVIQKFLDVLENNKNCRLAEPGEFTRTAFINNKINLYEAESISDLLNAETEAQRLQALRLKNSSPKFIEWRNIILDVMSKCEASIDFSEEDLPTNLLNDNIKKITKVAKEIDKMLDDKQGEIIREGFKIAILGAPNAGKSSFLNYLVKRKAAIVSEVQGTTRDIIQVQMQINNLPVIISDTAGIRNTKNKVEKIGVNLALKESRSSNLNILIMDGTKKIPKEIEKLVNAKSVILINKKDKKGFKGIHALGHKNGRKMQGVFEISLKNKKNLNYFNKFLEEYVSMKFNHNSNTLISRNRHRTLLKKCSNYLRDYLKTEMTNEVEKAAEDLRLAANSIGHIVGFIGVEEILGKIFKDFCIGK